MSNSCPGTATPSSLDDARRALALQAQVRIDQLAAVRRSAIIAIPTNMVVSFLLALVALNAGRHVDGITWFASSIAISVVRILFSRTLGTGVFCAQGLSDPDVSLKVERQLRISWQLALVAGFVWSFLPVLCDGYTTAQTLVILTSICGVTAGAITHGTACARIPICFITPPLLSTAACLLYQGGVDDVGLAAAVVLYLVALVRSSLQTEAAFQEASRLKNEATALAECLEVASRESAKVADEMRHRAAHDPLTDLLNRSGLMQAVEQARDDTASHHCLMLLDLDGFKFINDAFGHAAGDRVLIEIARRISDVLPEGAVAARLGGDEFAIFHTLTQMDETPLALADRLIDEIARPFEKLEAGRLGVSIGVHTFGADGIAEMLICADEALYAAKKGGRNRHCLFDDALRTRCELRRDSERALPTALAQRALEVWFQPIFASGGQVVSGFEALVRWRHPKHGWISPPEIIAAAATAGVSEVLLAFIVGEACRMSASLRSAGLKSLHLAINMSPGEVSQLPIDEIVFDQARRYGIELSDLFIEITEEAYLDVSAVRQKISNLTRAGVQLAVDDFGVGYSSLASIRNLRPNTVKIDRSLVKDIAAAPDDRAFVQAVLNLGRSMGFEVVAEGVETVEDLISLRSIGCQLFQGYYLGRPMPRDALLDWVQVRIPAAA